MVVPVLVSSWAHLFLLSLFAIYLTYNFPMFICHVLFLFLLSIPDMIILMLSNFNSSQMLELDDFWKLLATLLLPVSSQTKKPFSQFYFPSSGTWRILPSSNYSFSVGISFFVLILRSQMSPPCYVRH